MIWHMQKYVNENEWKNLYKNLHKPYQEYLYNYKMDMWSIMLWIQVNIHRLSIR